MSHPDSQRTDRLLEGLIERYATRKTPIQVNFRRLVPWFGSAERLTHLIHPYPAKLLMHIPHFFLANDLLSQPGDIVLDPFAGAGTVLLESLVAGRHAIGADSNAMARLIARVKTTPLSPRDLEAAYARILDAVPQNRDPDPPDVINIEHWFYPHVIKQLARLKVGIDRLEEGAFRDFFLVCFSACVRRVSLADPRLAVPVRLRENQYPDGHPLNERTKAHLRRLKRVNVMKVFSEIAASNTERMAAFAEVASRATAKVICSDARRLHHEFGDGTVRGTPLPDRSTQLVITSPPYPGAQKYVRAMSLSLGWLGLCKPDDLRAEKRKEIGREQYRKEEYGTQEEAPIEAARGVLESVRRTNPLRAHICSQYLCDMQRAIIEAERVLRPGGYFVLVAGNSRVCGREFRTAGFLRAAAQRAGLTLSLQLVDDIRSRGLMTKRNTTAGMILREHVLVFEKRHRPRGAKR